MGSRAPVTFLFRENNHRLQMIALASDVGLFNSNENDRLILNALL